MDSLVLTSVSGCMFTCVAFKDLLPGADALSSVRPLVTWRGYHSLPFLEEACLETVPGAEVVGLVPWHEFLHGLQDDTQLHTQQDKAVTSKKARVRVLAPHGSFFPHCGRAIFYSEKTLSTTFSPEPTVEIWWSAERWSRGQAVIFNTSGLAYPDNIWITS